MRIRKLVYATILLLALSSCNKEEEHYESKNVKVDSVFDKVDDADKADDKNQDTKNEQPAKEADNNVNPEDKNPNPVDDNQNDADANNQSNPNDDQNAKKYRAQNALNMRSEANVGDDNVIAVIDPGTEITALEETEANGNTWIRLEYQGQTGFVVKDLLEEVNN